MPALTTDGLWDRGKYWWIVLPRVHGAPPYRESTKIPVHGPTPELTDEYRRLALLKRAQRLTEQARGELGITKVDTVAAAVPTLRMFVEGDPAQPATHPRHRGYRRWLKADRPHSADETLRRLDALFLPTLGDLSLSEIRPAQIEGWRATRRASKVSAQTIDRDLSDLRGLLSKAVEWDAIAVHPLAELTMTPAPSQEIVRYLSADEESRLLTALAGRDAEAHDARARHNAWRRERGRPTLPDYGTYPDALTPLVMVALHTGVRRGELFRLTWRAIDWHGRSLAVIGERGRKNRKTRRVPLNSKVLPILKTWHAQGHAEQLVFPGRDGQVITNVQTSWEAVLKATGIVDFRWHDLRHTFASKLVMKGVSLYQVGLFLGHTTEATTRRYAHLAPDQSREAVELLAAP